MEYKNVERLEEKAKIIRRHVIKSIYSAGSGHPGGSLSLVDILTVLYFYTMRHIPSNPKWENRDIFILSKGHAAPALYATLAESGYFPIEELDSLRKIGSRLQGHPDHKVPGIEISSGSLGQGLSIACGVALSHKLDNKNDNKNKEDNKIYVLMGDGECDEGQVWEAAMFASHYRLDNLIAIIDRNYYQIDGLTEDIMSLEPLSLKWKSFGWNVIEIDGNNISEIINMFENIDKYIKKDKITSPTIIIAHTIKGKGISFMEGDNQFHGRAPNKKEMDIILKELHGT